MSALEHDAMPLEPVYPFNPPSQAVRLFEGTIDGLKAKDVHGVVELSCVPRPSVNWSLANDGDSYALAGSSEVNLCLRRTDGDVNLPGVVRGHLDGWSNGTAIGDPDAPLQRLLAHWFNLPALHGPLRLVQRTDDGGTRAWAGRWVTDTCGWRITLDARWDHSDVFSDLHQAHVYVMTHVMELCRVDGGTFTASSATPVLDALHIGFSFAFGRWVAPMLPVGLDATGHIAWENWSALHCDPARRVASGWLPPFEHTSLAEFVDCVVMAFSDDTRRDAMRFQLMLGVEGTNDRGFVEQRIMPAAAGIEHSMWQILVRGGQMTRVEYEGRGRPPASEKLRKTLKLANIRMEIDASILPAMALYAAKKGTSGSLDGPEAITRIRNRLMHPKDGQETVYKHAGLITDVWLLARHYLVLLVLYQLNYRGRYRDLRISDGFEGSNVADVPW